MSLCIVFNPVARGEKARRFRALLEQRRGAWALKPTTGPGTARALSRAAVLEGYRTVIAAGGDGTLNEVLNGLADAPDGLRQTRLGVIPLGTVNVFARELRLPLDFQKIWPVIEAGRETALDLGRARYRRGGREEQRHFVQLAGAGFDARAIELVNWELKKKAGVGAYVVAGLRALGAAHPPIEVSNGSQSETGQLVLVGNGRFYGGSFPLFRKSDLQDGLLDAVIFKRVDWAAFPGHLWDFVSRRMFTEGGPAYLQGASFRLTSSGPAPLQLEGELAGELPAQIDVLPRALRMIIP